MWFPEEKKNLNDHARRRKNVEHFILIKKVSWANELIAAVPVDGSIVCSKSPESQLNCGGSSMALFWLCFVLCFRRYIYPSCYKAGCMGRPLSIKISEDNYHVIAARARTQTEGDDRARLKTLLETLYWNWETIPELFNLRRKMRFPSLLLLWSALILLLLCLT